MWSTLFSPKIIFSQKVKSPRTSFFLPNILISKSSMSSGPRHLSPLPQSPPWFSAQKRSPLHLQSKVICSLCTQTYFLNFIIFFTSTLPRYPQIYLSVPQRTKHFPNINQASRQHQTDVLKKTFLWMCSKDTTTILFLMFKDIFGYIFIFTILFQMTLKWLTCKLFPHCRDHLCTPCRDTRSWAKSPIREI